MQDRLPNAFLAGAADEAAYTAKSGELKLEVARTEEALGRLADVAPTCREMALGAFDWSQTATAAWKGSTDSARRQILDAVYLNRTLSATSLVTTKRKPFDQLAERLENDSSRGDRRFTFPIEPPGWSLFHRAIAQRFEFTALELLASGQG
jgi:site-specific DNA recombinase